jgi:hypothetical protein
MLAVLDSPMERSILIRQPDNSLAFHIDFGVGFLNLRSFIP